MSQVLDISDPSQPTKLGDTIDADVLAARYIEQLCRRITAAARAPRARAGSPALPASAFWASAPRQALAEAQSLCRGVGYDSLSLMSVGERQRRVVSERRHHHQRVMQGLVHESNVEAISLYTKLGFSTEHRVEGYYGPGAASLVMSAAEDSGICSRAAFARGFARRRAVVSASVYH